jgi:6-phosphogluconolactonase (cycloisomerase 2 family)
MRVVQIESTLGTKVTPIDTGHPQTVSHLALTDDMRFLYVGNRGPQSSLAGYAVDAATGWRFRRRSVK